MKKLLVVAAIGVAGFLSANGKVEKKIEVKKASVAFQLCGVLVTFYNSDGKPTSQQWFTSDQPDLIACMTYQNGVINNLRAQGYRVQQMSSDVN